MKTLYWLAFAAVCACGKGKQGAQAGSAAVGSSATSAVRSSAPVGSGTGSMVQVGSATADAQGSAAMASPRDPARAQAANTRGMKLLAAKKYQEAMAEFEAAIAADDRDVLAHYNLACAASRAQDEPVSSRELIWVASAAAWDATAARALKKVYSDPDLEWERAEIPENANLEDINRDLLTPFPTPFAPVPAAALKVLATAPGKHDDLCDPNDARQAGARGVSVEPDGKQFVAASLRDGVALVDEATVVTRTEPLGCIGPGASQDELSALYVTNATDAAPAGLAGRELVVVLYSQGGRRSWTNNIAIFAPEDDLRLKKAHQLAKVFEATLASSDDAEASTLVLTGTADLVLGPAKAAHKQLFRWNQATFAYQKSD